MLQGNDMNDDLSLDARTLDKGRICRIHETRPFGHRIECLSGSLWITQDGDRRDIVPLLDRERDPPGTARLARASRYS